MDNRELAVKIAMDTYARVRFGGATRQWADLNGDTAPQVFAEMVSDLAADFVAVAAYQAENWDRDEDHMEGEEGDFAVSDFNDGITLSDWLNAEKLLPSYMCLFLGDEELKEFASDCDEDDHLEYLLRKRDEMLRLFRHSRRVAILARKFLNGEKVEADLSVCLAKSGY